MHDIEDIIFLLRAIKV